MLKSGLFKNRYLVSFVPFVPLCGLLFKLTRYSNVRYHLRGVTRGPGSAESSHDNKDDPLIVPSHNEVDFAAWRSVAYVPDGVVGNRSFCCRSLLLVAARTCDRSWKRDARDRRVGSGGSGTFGAFDRPAALRGHLALQTDLLETRRGASPVLIAARYIDTNHLRRSQ